MEMQVTQVDAATQTWIIKWAGRINLSTFAQDWDINRAGAETIDHGVRKSFFLLANLLSTQIDILESVELRHYLFGDSNSDCKKTSVIIWTAKSAAQGLEREMPIWIREMLARPKSDRWSLGWDSTTSVMSKISRIR